jgi:hypothetical protein
VVEQTTEPKTEPAKPEPTKAEGTPKPEDKKAEGLGAPEKYTEFKVPDGFVLDPKVAEEAGTLFKQNGLSQDQAQSLIDFHVAKTKEAAEAPYKAWNDMGEQWLKETQDDPEIGGKLEEIKQNVGKALKTLDPKLEASFREIMDLTKAGNHPAFVKVLNAFAKAVTEGKPVAKGGPTNVENPQGRPPSAAQALFPNLPSANRTA